MGYILRQLSCILFILRHIVTFCASYELYTTNNAAYIYLAFRNYTCWTYTFVFHRTEMLYFHWFKNKTWLPNLVFLSDWCDYYSAIRPMFSPLISTCHFILKYINRVRYRVFYLDLLSFEMISLGCVWSRIKRQRRYMFKPLRGKT